MPFLCRNNKCIVVWFGGAVTERAQNASNGLWIYHPPLPPIAWGSRHKHHLGLEKVGFYSHRYAIIYLVDIVETVRKHFIVMCFTLAGHLSPCRTNLLAWGLQCYDTIFVSRDTTQLLYHIWQLRHTMCYTPYILASKIRSTIWDIWVWSFISLTPTVVVPPSPQARPVPSSITVFPGTILPWSADEAYFTHHDWFQCQSRGTCIAFLR